MGYGVGRDVDGDAGLEAIVAALVEPIGDANLRAQFLGFAQLNARAA